MDVVHFPFEECTTRDVEAIEFDGKLIPFDELIIGPGGECPFPGCGCDEDHWHAANFFDALALDGTRVRDPNPSQCGYGKVSEVPTVKLGEVEDCSGKVVSVDGSTVKTLAPGRAVITLRPCVGAGAKEEEIAAVKAIELEIVVIVPWKLSARLEAIPDTLKTVDRGSQGPQCLAAACGDSINLVAEACPKKCEDLLVLDDTGASTAGRACDFIREPLQRVADGVAEVELPEFKAPVACGIHKALLRCKDRPHNALEPIHIHVVGVEKIIAVDPVPVDTEVPFTVEYCEILRNCERDPRAPPDCDMADLVGQVKELVKRTEFFVVEPGGVRTALAPPAGPLQTSFSATPTGVIPRVPRFLAPQRPGTWKFIARLGECEKEIEFEVEPRTKSRPTSDSEPEHPRNRTKTGDPVLTHSGEALYRTADLVVPGRGLPFSWERVYKSRFKYTGPLGNNWDFTYNERLEYADTDADGDVDVIHTVMLYQTTYLRTGDGPLDYLVPDGHYKRLRRNGDGSFSLRYPQGTVKTFHGPGDAPLEGLLREIVDSTGLNRLRFEYNGARELTTIFDTYDRPYTLEWAGGKIHKLIDFSGREVVYEYYGPGDDGGNDGDLRSVRCPVVTGTPNGNDFPEGKTHLYTYMTGAVHPELIGNLLTVTMPNEVARGGPPELINTYGTDPDDPLTFDRVITQVEGGVNHTGIPSGGTYQYYYEDLGGDPADPLAPRRRTVVVDRNGNVEEYIFGNAFQLLEKRRYTGRVDPLVRLPHAIEARSPGLRSAFEAAEGRPGPDPDFYASRYVRNRHGELVERVFPEGNRLVRVYAFEDDPNPLRRGNLTEERWIADPDRLVPGPGETTERSATYTYEPFTNRVASAVEFRGNDPDHDGPDADTDPDGPARYRSSFLFDYQEITDVASVRDEAAAWGIEIPAGFALGLGDQNGDGAEGPMYGLPIVERRPAATVQRWDGESIVFDPPQEAAALTRYNVFGQVTATVDFEENVSELFYYPSSDPDGDGLDLIAGGDPDTGGYLRALVRDTAAAPGRNSGRDPVPENRASRFRYNTRGFVIERIDGRGVATLLVRNALDQVVRTVEAASVDPDVRGEERPEDALAVPLGYVEDRFYDHNNNLVRVERENRDSGTDARNPTFDRDMEYDIRNNLVSRSVEVDETTRAVWEYRYDANDNRVLVRKPEGNEVRTTYDERDLVFTITDGANDPSVAATVVFAYDRNGNSRFAIDSEDNDGDGLPEVAETVHDGWNRVRRIIDPAGQERAIDLDVADNVVRIRVFGTEGGPTPRRGDGTAMALLSEVRASFDERGRRIREDVTLFGPYTEGLETLEGPLTPGDGAVTTLTEYDRKSRVVRIVDDRGNDALLGYNGVSEVILEASAEIHGARNRREIFHDRAGNPFRIIETEILPDSTTESFERVRLFDALNRPVRSTDPIGQTTYTAYDSRSHMTVSTDAKGPIIDSDPTGATDLVINAPGNTVRMVTDGLGRTIEHAIDLRPGGVGTGSPAFDVPPDPALVPGDVESTEANPDGVILQRTTYDLNSRLVAYEDDRGNVTRFAYDARDRKTAQVHADGTRWEMSYDRDSNLVALDDPRGVVQRFAYDGLHRQVAVVIDRSTAPEVGGTTRIEREYDGLDRLTRASDDNDPLEPADDRVDLWAWDSLSLPIRETQDGTLVERRFDSVGNRLATVYPDGGPVLEATYDSLDRCEVVTLDRGIDGGLDGGGGSTTLCRTEYAGPVYRRLLQRLGNGLETISAYDGKRRLLAIETRSAPDGAEVITGRAYSYDRADNRVSERWLERVAAGGHDGRVYDVDSLGRFAAARPAVLDAADGVVAEAPPDEGFRWLLDGAGNWVEEQTPAGTRRTAFDAVNEDTAHRHDPAGNRAGDESRRHVFDALNRLIEVLDTEGNGVLERYTYDGSGRRATRTVLTSDGSASTTRFIYAGAHVIEERTGAVVSARNYHEPSGVDRLVTREVPDLGLLWLHRDVVMSTTALTGASGEVVERYEYEPFGATRFLDAGLGPVLDGEGAPVAESPAGNPYLFTGRRLDRTGLYYFRARYLDPARGRFLSRDAGLDPVNTGNLFSYAGLNPLVYNDPWGASGQESGWQFEWSWSKAGNMLWELGGGVVDAAVEAHDAASSALAWGIWNTSPIALGYRLATDPAYTLDEIARDVKSLGGTAAGLADLLNNWIYYHNQAIKADSQLTDEKWMRKRGSRIVLAGASGAINLEMHLAAELGAGARLAGATRTVGDAADTGGDLARSRKAGRGGTVAKRRPIDPVTKKTMDDYGMTPDTYVYRTTPPEYLDMRTMQAKGNPRPTALIDDVYAPDSTPPQLRRLGMRVPNRREADTLSHPALNVAIERPSRYAERGHEMIRIRMADILDQGGRIYPDIGSELPMIRPLIVTLPRGQVPFQLVR